MANIKRFQGVTSSYEQKKKDELVVLGQGKKSYQEILVYLENEIARSKQITAFNYTITCFLADGAYQLNKAVEEVYGAAINKGEDTPSNGEDPVNMIDVKLSDGSRIKVPFGKIDTPDLGKGSYINVGYKHDTNQLFIEGRCMFQFQSLVDNIVGRTEQLLNTDSIYKNQAFELDANFDPKAINLDNIDKEFMILSEAAEYELLPLKSRILHPELCIEKKIPLKYGVLLEGVYGTGKTLLAFKLAKQAIGNNWTFIYLKDPTLLARTLKLSKTLDKNGHGVIVFVEDIDQVTRGNRDNAMQDILNTLDGGDTKNMNVIAMFTTNHIELIEPTFLRGKRIGSVISLGYLDANTAEEFLKFSFTEEGGYKLDNPKNIKEVAKYISEKNIAPAFMAEIVESIKAKMVFQDNNRVEAKHIKASVDGYLRQVGLSNKKDMTETAADKLATGFAEVIVGPTVTRLVREQVAAELSERELDNRG